ncbi:uncharacterized protein LOC128172150 isoform X2 [Crassostrea angulata]|uniref:uncharacterized protein LOC128172150 isoform X2 n=1 Tax=Magallana angulata TaxID=2784310 RepID=UPI0022B124DC|nr:uncharacterized protein LOC128172150 isoform X2 [Crassostrea angulata]
MMSLRTTSVFLLIGALLIALTRPNEYIRLEGYEFPVYSTDSCPGNDKEWKERSTAINCTKNNGYMCFPNEDITGLLQFCYIYTQLLITKDTCLFLNKRHSRVDSVNCSHFTNGCPYSPYYSYKIFDYPSCISTGNGCFLAEPNCTRRTLPTTLFQKNTDPTTLENITINDKNDYSTTSSEETTNHIYKEKNQVSKKDVAVLVLTVLGIFIAICAFYWMCFCSREGNPTRKETYDKENLDEMEMIPFIIGKDKYQMESTEDSFDPIDRTKSAHNKVMQEWQKEDDFFVSTRACKKVEEVITNHRTVLVTGQAGSGKSAIIQHIALKYKNEGWIVKSLSKLVEIKQEINLKRNLRNKILLVINDPVGKESFDEIAYRSWKRCEETLKTSVNDVKILMSSRNYVLRDGIFERLVMDKQNVEEINIDQYPLDDNEKHRIWDSHLSKHVLIEDVDLEEEFADIVKVNTRFPLKCKSYISAIRVPNQTD